MNQKTLIGLGAITLVAAIAAFAIHHARRPASDVGAQAGLLVPGLREHVNDVKKLTLTGANHQPVATLERTDGIWKVAQKGGYPADFGKLRDYLLRVADATLVERKTANKERYATLGVEDVTAPDAKGTLVEIDGLAEPARIVVGLFDGQGGSGTFVRRAAEEQSWLAKGTLSPDKTAADWVRKDLANIASDRVASVTITRADGKRLHVSKDSAADGPFKVADVPKGRAVSSEYVANGLASVLAELRLEDVVPAAESPRPDKTLTARYVTFDGLVVEAAMWPVGEKQHVAFKALLDEAAATAHVEREQAKAAAEHAAIKPAEAVEGAPPPAATEPPLAVSDPAADRTQRIEAAKKEAAELAATFDGWVFVLPAHKVSNIDKSLEDMLAPVEAKPAKGS